MLKVITVASVIALALAINVTPKPAFAHDGGAVAAGVVGGLAVGAVIGSQMNRDDDNDYQTHRAYYRGCHMERREFSDRYGHEHFRRVRVCD